MTICALVLVVTLLIFSGGILGCTADCHPQTRQRENHIKTKKFSSGTEFKRILLVAPKHPENFWSMQGTADILGAKTLMPNSALATLMALTPNGVSVEYALMDENIGDIDYDFDCDLVAITGNTIHAGRIHELCRIFKQRGIPIALGGAYATLESDRCSGLADFHFIGEAEYTWPAFLRQWIKGNPKKIYHQSSFIKLADSPPPDWSLIDPNDYINISVQTSRGCPHGCDFCDVIQYVGQRYRTKTVEQVLTEVKKAYAVGARTVFFSDDNFLGHKSFTKSLLKQLTLWNCKQPRPLSFSTQITVKVADDTDLLRMFAEARFSVLFLGVETIRKESLAEVNKSHNLTQNIYKRIQKISSFGIVPFIGLIVGFDHDDQSVFDQLEYFLNTTHSPIAGVSLLNAPRHTPLYKRLKRENRLSEDGFSGEWQLKTNIIPKQMSRETLLRLYRDFFQRIYQPDAFGKRLMMWMQNIDYADTNIYTNKKMDMKQLKFGYRILMHFIFKVNPHIRTLFFKTLIETWKTNPKQVKRLFTLMTQYGHFHHFVQRFLST